MVIGPAATFESLGHPSAFPAAPERSSRSAAWRSRASEVKSQPQKLDVVRVVKGKNQEETSDLPIKYHKI